jgi:predicted metal-dependent hydrolase
MSQNGGKGAPADTTVIRKAVRCARLQVLPDGTLRVVAPQSFDVDRFLHRHAVWIERRRLELDRMGAEGVGKEHRLLMSGRFYQPVRGPLVAFDEESAIITYPSLAGLKKSLIRMLKDDVFARLQAYPDLVGPELGRVTVKMQKTKWGSCSSRRNLNFNLRVIALPGRLREYIVVHEAAHLKEHNHSDRFWHLVRLHFPDYRIAEAELKRYWIILERNQVWQALRTAG